MKKAILFSFLSLVAIKTWAIQAPTSSNGSALPIEYVGCQTAQIDSSTGTSLIVLNSTGTGGVSTGRAIVYGVITSSIAQGDYLVLKDTTGKGANGHVASQVLLQGVGSTIAVVTNWLQQQTSTLTANLPYPVLNMIKFPVPLQFNNGILAVTSAAPTTNSGISRWTILYRKLDQGEK